MASYDILIPPLDDYEQRQDALGIEPEELAIAGLSMIGNIDNRYVKKTDLIADYGYVMPYTHQGQQYWLRGLYLHENESYDPIGIPRIPEELPGHLQWHQTELQRLKDHGFSIAQHLPVVVKDKDRWGESGYGVFTIVESVEGPSLETSLKSKLPWRQKPALEAITRLAAYYDDPERPEGHKYMRDICYMRQYIGNCLVDLDPLQDDSPHPNELAHLNAESRKLRSREGKELHQRINTAWLAQLDAVIDRVS